jgi:hypothetical protein
MEEIATKRALIRRSAFSHRGANFSGSVSASAASEAAFHRSFRELTCDWTTTLARLAFGFLADTEE